MTENVQFEPKFERDDLHRVSLYLGALKRLSDLLTNGAIYGEERDIIYKVFLSRLDALLTVISVSTKDDEGKKALYKIENELEKEIANFDGFKFVNDYKFIRIYNRLEVLFEYGVLIE